MSKEFLSFIELAVIFLCTTGRLIATASIVWILVHADITNGWKVFLLALTIVIGLSFSVKYHNPDDEHEAPAQIQKEEKKE